MHKTITSAMLYITGRVQNVWYRAFTLKEAEKLGLTGWVKNNPDGSVGADVQGSRNNIERFVEILKIGPPFASVKNIDLKWGIPKINFDHFEIR